MQRALNLAKKGMYSCKPNPAVGCVLVKNNEIVGEGYHKLTGSEHAEVNALNQALDKAKGSTCYVSLEPCAHYGRTGPCVEALIESGVSEYYIATKDPFSEVAGKGIEKLRDNNFKVNVGLLENEALEINRGFFSRATKKRPFITAKIAISLDGKVAMSDGDSKWISGEISRENVQELRAKSCGVLTGISTVLADNPRLDVRLDTLVEKINKQPVRFILDTNSRLPLDSQLLKVKGDVVLITAKDNKDLGRYRQLDNLKIEQVEREDSTGRLNLHKLGEVFVKYEINNLLVEAGPSLVSEMLKQGLIDSLIIYIAPKILGGNTIDMFNLENILNLDSAVKLKYKEIAMVGDDIKVEALVK